MSTLRVPAVEPFYHPPTGAYAYLAYDPQALSGVIVDPVLDFDRRSGRVATTAADEILRRVRELGLTLAWVLETHAHADHLSAAHYIKRRLGCPVATGSGVCTVQATAARMFGFGDQLARDGSQFDHLWRGGERFAAGDIECSVLETPGHTPDSVTYLIGDCAFVGDTLFLPYLGTARCDFPGGSPQRLYESIRSLYELSGATRVMVGHDYPPAEREPHHTARIEEERRCNVHLSERTPAAEFVAFREQRDRTLPLPELFFFALQVNVCAGRLPPAAHGARHLRVPIELEDDTLL